MGSWLNFFMKIRVFLETSYYDKLIRVRQRFGPLRDYQRLKSVFCVQRSVVLPVIKFCKIWIPTGFSTNMWQRFDPN